MQIVRVFKPQTERKNFLVLVGVRNSGHRAAPQKILREKRQGSTKTEKGLLLSSVVLVQVVLYTKKKHGRRTSTNTLSNSNIIIIVE